MCELFGMSASHPLAASETLARLRLRGGLEADNPDGWGIAWLEGSAFRLAKEPLPAHESAHFEQLAGKIRAPLIIAHVRKARHPPVNTLDNTHPFLSECCGREWAFAHNGLVPDIVGMERENRHAVCRPAGETDSEYAFCHLLSHLAREFDAHPANASLGKFNFLLSDGERLIAYGHDRLHHLERDGHVLVATEPLTGEAEWQPFGTGELRIYRAGQLAGRLSTRPRHTGHCHMEATS